ncbi:MAG: hypothetical protein OEM63_12150 [Gammaproteobacteria bacterium]|nr:hypothetical protein [Gammaproteobacteria bacterium]
MNRLIKTFLIATIVGALGTGALTWYVPVVDLHRERSMISVQPNGGNIEEFHINLPRDRVMVGLPNPDAAIPAALEWPGQEVAGDMQAEIFKIRDRNETVIGVGSRIASAAETTGPFIEWSLHLPARGSIYVKMEITPSADGFRNGTMVSGTRDFAELSGSVRELFIADVADSADVQSRIQLQTALVGSLGDIE